MWRRRLTSLAIISFWMTMMGLLLRRDVLPTYGYGDLDFRRTLLGRAVDEATLWSIELDGKKVGSTLTVVRIRENGSAALRCRTSIESGLLDNRENDASRIVTQSDFYISRTGQLERFDANLSVEGARLRFSVAGVVEDDELVVKAEGLPFGKNEPLRMRIDPSELLLDPFGPIDRFPELRVGKRWKTRTINPIGALLAGVNPFGASTPVMEEIHHEVVGVETFAWNGRDWDCFVLESRWENQRVRAWVARADGRALAQETVVGKARLTLRREPQPKDLAGSEG